MIAKLNKVETMSSQLARELMEDLAQQEAATPAEVYANSNMDEESDHSEDEAESPILGHEMCEAGKFKGKKDYMTVYLEEKSYVQCVRSHVGVKSCTGMKKLRLYVERAIRQRRFACRPNGQPSRRSRRTRLPAVRCPCCQRTRPNPRPGAIQVVGQSAVPR